ncbi:MAG: 3-oxoacyl-[acyl-carrier-protein] reductase [Atribacterota bacterium]|nr:3-oxoacyl-[acyl-carrier-protein] reductase [Atribacterota bacterium]
MSIDLKGKTALITGGVRGIGKAIALRLAESGANIVVNYIKNEEAARLTAKEISDLGRNCITVQGDVSIPEEAQRIIQASLDVYKTLDILVNNAGITRDYLLIRMKEKDFSQVISTNLLGTFYCTKYASKFMMKAHYGKIINLSSVVGIAGNFGQANYAAAKAGIIGFTKSAAKELGARNITVNAIAPGFIKTDMTDSLTEEQKEKILTRISLGRFGLPKEVANMVNFLVSNEADYITGQVFRIDGGMEI